MNIYLNTSADDITPEKVFVGMKPDIFQLKGNNYFERVFR